MMVVGVFDTGRGDKDAVDHNTVELGRYCVIMREI
jgi:hypothetical protein